jgi:hypothetical protein
MMVDKTGWVWYDTATLVLPWLSGTPRSTDSSEPNPITGVFPMVWGETVPKTGT